MKKSKILIIIPRMLAGGAEKVVAWLSDNLCKDGYDLTVFSLQRVNCFYKLNEKVKYKTGATVVLSNSKNKRRFERLKAFPEAYSSVLNELKNNDYSIVISFNPSADLIIGLINCFGIRVPYICSERNDPHQINRIKSSILKYFYKRAKAFVCQSSTVKEYYDSYLNNTVIIPNAIDLSIVPTRVDSVKNKFVAVGRLDTQKNYDLMISAFSEFNKHDNSFVLDIYGDGLKKEYLQELIKSKGMENKVTLKGVSKDVLSEIKGAYAFLMTSDFEGFPNVIMEAMSVGLPIITTDFSPGTAKDLVDSENGIVVPCNNQEKLVKAMIYLTQNKQTRDEMSAKSTNKIKAYDISFVYPIWRQLIQSIVDEQD